MDINWKASLVVSPLIYVFTMIVIGDLLINSVRESVGPVTDMVITGLVLLIIVYIAARKNEEEMLWGGVLAGIFCFVAQVILTSLTVGVSLIALLIQLVLFLGLALTGGFVAQRL